MGMLVHHLLERQAHITPDRLVAIEAGTRLTYGQLEAKANRLAHALVDSGVKRGDRVAIMLENGVDAVIAVFATFKAGAAIMMLHPSARGERLQYVLEDACPTAFVSDAEHVLASAIDLQAIPSIRVLVSSARDPSVAAPGHFVGWADLSSF